MPDRSATLPTELVAAWHVMAPDARRILLAVAEHLAIGPVPSSPATDRQRAATARALSVYTDAMFAFLIGALEAGEQSIAKG